MYKIKYYSTIKFQSRYRIDYTSLVGLKNCREKNCRPHFTIAVVVGRIALYMRAVYCVRAYNLVLFLLVFLDIRSRPPAQSHGVPRGQPFESDRPAKIDSFPRNEINKNGEGGVEQEPSTPHVP